MRYNNFCFLHNSCCVVTFQRYINNIAIFKFAIYLTVTFRLNAKAVFLQCNYIPYYMCRVSCMCFRMCLLLMCTSTSQFCKYSNISSIKLIILPKYKLVRKNRINLFQFNFELVNKPVRMFLWFYQIPHLMSVFKQLYSDIQTNIFC